MPGSSLSLSGPDVILNTAVAESLAGFLQGLRRAYRLRADSAILKLLKDTFYRPLQGSFSTATDIPMSG